MVENRTTRPESTDSPTWGHKWGFADTEFVLHSDGAVELVGDRYNLSGYKMYDFLPYAEGVLGVKFDWENRQFERGDKPVAPPMKNAAFCEAVSAGFKSDQYTFDDAVRLLHSHGQTTAEEVWEVLYESLHRFADMVFFPETEDDVARIVELSSTHDVCLVPYGGGTSVSCALLLPASETRMIVSVDMCRMNRVLWIDHANRRACVEAGIRGGKLEQELMREGFTCGHEPDSIELSTLGGWIATNASGMKKNRYGNIEQVVEQITLVTPTGVIDQAAPLPRASIGVQPQNVLFGNEGNFGIITKAVIKIHKAPEVTKYGSLVFPNFDLGTRFLNKLAYTGFVPASIRLVDNTQFQFGMALKAHVSGWKRYMDKLKKFYVTRIVGLDPKKMVAATIVMEGSQSEVEYQQKNLKRLAKEFKGIPAGAEAGQRGYMLTYAIAYIRDFVSTFHVIGETFETSVPWSKIGQVCDAVRKRADELHVEHNLPGTAYISYRITQIYHTGVCIYFMYSIYTKGVSQPSKVFSQIEHSLREAIIENGGSISHHHGVGKLRKDFVKDTLSEGSIEFIKGMKKSVDPKNVFGISNNIFAE